MTRLLVTTRELKSDDRSMVEGGEMLAIPIADVNVISGCYYICFYALIKCLS